MSTIYKTKADFEIVESVINQNLENQNIEMVDEKSLW